MESERSILENGEFWYSESQGSERDAEILDRYETIISHYRGKEQKISAETRLKLENLYYSDAVLKSDEVLRGELCNFLFGGPPWTWGF